MKNERYNNGSTACRSQWIDQDEHSVAIELVVGLILCVLTFLLFYIYILIPTFQYNTYQMDMTKIKPYVTEDEIDLIQSKWVQIQCKEDYQEISKWIADVKQKNGLE